MATVIATGDCGFWGGSLGALMATLPKPPPPNGTHPWNTPHPTALVFCIFKDTLVWGSNFA